MGKGTEEWAAFPEHMKLLLVCINRTHENKTHEPISTYDAARYSWPVKPEKAQQAEYVMAVFRGVIVGVFEADEWFPAQECYFHDLPPGHGNWDKQANRFGFVGRSVSNDVEERYRDKSVPKQWGFTGNSVRYVNF